MQKEDAFGCVFEYPDDSTLFFIQAWLLDDKFPLMASPYATTDEETIESIRKILGKKFDVKEFIELVKDFRKSENLAMVHALPNHSDREPYTPGFNDIVAHTDRVSARDRVRYSFCNGSDYFKMIEELNASQSLKRS